jgi:hypothetical protein
MPRSISDVSDTDHRNRYRVGKCGKYARKPESIERARKRLCEYWGDPETRRRQSELTRARMAQPGVKEKISERTRAALADPAVRQRQRAGLAAVWTREKRDQQRQLTIARMARWRANQLEAAETVLRQIPKADRAAVLGRLVDASGKGPRG